MVITAGTKRIYSCLPEYQEHRNTTKRPTISNFARTLLLGKGGWEHVPLCFATVAILPWRCGARTVHVRRGPLDFAAKRATHVFQAHATVIYRVCH